MLHSVIIWITLLGTALASLTLPEFQQSFAEHSQVVAPELKEFRSNNNKVRQELIHSILSEMANLTLEMRQISAETWEYIENSENTNEDCLADLRNEFEYYVRVGELDIKLCAMDMDYYLRYDAENRFNSWAFFKERENGRAISQTVQTLGRNRPLDNWDGTVAELQEELDYFRTLWDSFQVVLKDELNAMEPFAEAVLSEMDFWYDYAIRWHTLYMQWVIDDIEYFCVE